MAEYEVATLKLLQERAFDLINKFDLEEEGEVSIPLREACADLKRDIESFMRNPNVRLPATLADGFNKLGAQLQVIARLAGDKFEAEQISEWHRELGECYERIIRFLRDSEAASPYKVLGDGLNTLRPKNYVRNVVHIGNACVAAFCYHFYLDKLGGTLVLFSVLMLYVGMDVARRLFPAAEKFLFDGIMRRIVRPRERHEIPAATWYLLALMLVMWFTDKMVAEIATLVLGFGDPFATVFGKLLRGPKIWREKTYAGFAGFVLASFVVVSAWLLALSELEYVTVFAVSLLASFVGAVAECCSTDFLDDNFLIPVAVGVVISVVFPVSYGPI